MTANAPRPPIAAQRMAELRLLFCDDAELGSLFQDFFGELPSRMLTLEAGLRKQTPELVNVAAHAIKGSSSSLGANDIYEAARGLEECARSRHLEQAGPWVETLQTEIHRLHDYLSENGFVAA